MRKKIMNVVLFLAVLAAALGMTLYVGNSAASVLIYNFIFLGIIAVVYIVGLFGGMFRMNKLSLALKDAADELEDAFKMPGRVAPDKVASLNGIFHHAYLDSKMKAFTDSIAKSQEGIVDIEEFLNEDDLDMHVHKRLLEMAPDLFTSIGILGTFVGLVWGLKDFQPSDYQAMTSSVSSLVDGIKVAFLTSIYGIAFSIVYTSGMKSEYSSMTENLQLFLDRFHTYVMPSAESESMNLLVASQKNQTAAMNQMAEQFSVKMADSFEKVITPTFKKMNDSLDTLVDSVTRCQEDAVKEILDAFLKEMNASFETQFADFGKALTQLKDAQTDNVNYTTNLYQAMSRQLSDAYVEHETTMKKMLEESVSIQKEYISVAGRIVHSGLHVTRPCRNMLRLQRREWNVFPQRAKVMRMWQKQIVKLLRRLNRNFRILHSIRNCPVGLWNRFVVCLQISRRQEAEIMFSSVVDRSHREKRWNSFRKQFRSRANSSRNFWKRFPEISVNFPKVYRKVNSVYSDKRRSRCAKRKNQKEMDLTSGVLILI